ATVEEVEEIYYEAWKLGVKALAIYRDNCKVGQPLSAKTKDSEKAEITEKTEDTIRAAVEKVVEYRPVRKRLPKGRPGITTSDRATVEEVEEIYYEAWKLGVKALAIYRDNCKVGQPLSAKTKDSEKAEITEKTEDTIRAAVEKVVEYRPVRKRLPKGRPGITTSFTVGGAEG